jgi:hypothetical protein
MMIICMRAFVVIWVEVLAEAVMDTFGELGLRIVVRAGNAYTVAAS